MWPHCHHIAILSRCQLRTLKLQTSAQFPSDLPEALIKVLPITCRLSRTFQEQGLTRIAYCLRFKPKQLQWKGQPTPLGTSRHVWRQCKIQTSGLTLASQDRSLLSSIRPCKRGLHSEIRFRQCISIECLKIWQIRQQKSFPKSSKSRCLRKISKLRLRSMTVKDIQSLSTKVQLLPPKTWMLLRLHLLVYTRIAGSLSSSWKKNC